MQKLLIYCRNTYHFTLIAGVILCGFSFSTLAEERKYKIEAAYLYNFFNYITWPGYSTPQELLEPVICIYEDDPILPALEYVRNKMSVEREFTIRPLLEESQTTGCHIFFMRHRISHMATPLSNSTLTVLKPDDPLDRGGMIELSEEGERIAVKINQSQLERNGFHVSSRLLDLARR